MSESNRKCPKCEQVNMWHWQFCPSDGSKRPEVAVSEEDEMALAIVNAYRGVVSGAAISGPPLLSLEAVTANVEMAARRAARACCEIFEKRSRAGVDHTVLGGHHENCDIFQPAPDLGPSQKPCNCRGRSELLNKEKVPTECEEDKRAIEELENIAWRHPGVGIALLAKAREIIGKEAEALRAKLAYAKSERDLLKQAVNNLGGIICMYRKDGEGATETAARLLSEQQTRIGELTDKLASADDLATTLQGQFDEAIGQRDELRRKLAEREPAKPSAGAVFDEIDHELQGYVGDIHTEGWNLAIDTARKAVSRARDTLINEPAKPSGLPAVGEELWVIAEVARHRPAVVPGGVEGFDIAPVSTSLYCPADEGKTWRRVQPAAQPPREKSHEEAGKPEAAPDTVSTYTAQAPEPVAGQGTKVGGGVAQAAARTKCDGVGKVTSEAASKAAKARCEALDKLAAAYLKETDLPASEVMVVERGGRLYFEKRPLEWTAPARLAAQPPSDLAEFAGPEVRTVRESVAKKPSVWLKRLEALVHRSGASVNAGEALEAARADAAELLGKEKGEPKPVVDKVREGREEAPAERTRSLEPTSGQG